MVPSKVELRAHRSSASHQHFQQALVTCNTHPTASSGVGAVHFSQAGIAGCPKTWRDGRLPIHKLAPESMCGGRPGSPVPFQLVLLLLSSVYQDGVTMESLRLSMRVMMLSMQTWVRLAPFPDRWFCSTRSVATISRLAPHAHFAIPGKHGALASQRCSSGHTAALAPSHPA